MKISGISKAELAQQLKEMGLSQENEEQILSIFDKVDSDESINNVQHGDGRLSGVEMGELIDRAREFLGEKANDLRNTLMKTGVFAEREIDEDLHGTEYEIRKEYDANGNNTRRTIDKNIDGEIDTEIRMEYDAKRNMTRYTVDKDGDDKKDYEIRAEYNIKGNMTHLTEDRDGDDKIDYEEHLKYDTKGRLTHWTKDKDGDGKIDYQAWKEYDENGKTRYKYDIDGDGKVDHVGRWERDASFKKDIGW